MQERDYTLDEFRNLFEQVRKMGPMWDTLGSMPGMSGIFPPDQDSEQAFLRIQCMIDAMTEAERRDVDLIDEKSCGRIASDSGTEPRDVAQFVDAFKEIRALMRQMSKMSMWARLGMVNGMGTIDGLAQGDE